VAGDKLRWFTCPHTVNHTNRAGRRVTLLIETNTLPISQAASMLKHTFMWTNCRYKVSLRKHGRRPSVGVGQQLFLLHHATGRLKYPHSVQSLCDVAGLPSPIAVRQGAYG